MSLEIEELKAQIIRRFKRRLNKLGIVRIDLVTDEEATPNVQQPSAFERIKKRLSTAFLLRVCEVALLLSVFPTVLPNFKINYERPAQAALVCVQTVQKHLAPEPPSADPFKALPPISAEMAVSTDPPSEPAPVDSPDFQLDIRRPCRGRSRSTA